jgi:hypothetical protein
LTNPFFIYGPGLVNGLVNNFSEKLMDHHKWLINSALRRELGIDFHSEETFFVGGDMRDVLDSITVIYDALRYPPLQVIVFWQKIGFGLFPEYSVKKIFHIGWMRMGLSIISWMKNLSEIECR